MEVKKDLIGKKTPSLRKISKDKGVSPSRLKGQMTIGAKIEREHTKSGAEAREIARDHLKEIPDYYTRLKKMEKEAGIKEYDDELERMHNANRERILQGAREGKYWLLRSEEREALIDKIIETTTTGSIGSYNMGMGIASNDPAMGGRNRFNRRQLIFAIQQVKGKRGSLAP